MVSCPWDYMKPATMKFCEENLCSWITQPSNAFSSFIYIFVGLGLFFLYKTKKNSLVKTIPLISILIGINSFLYHASFSFFFQIFDLASMFLLSSFLIIFNLKRMNLIKKFHLPFLFVFLIQFTLLLVIRQKSGAIIFGLFIIMSIFLEIILSIKAKQTKYKNYLLAILFLIIGLIIWILDITQITCNPSNHFINGHALWHIINAGGIIFIYKFYEQFKFKK